VAQDNTGFHLQQSNYSINEIKELQQKKLSTRPKPDGDWGGNPDRKLRLGRVLPCNRRKI
jgi:hypothetical protein